MNREQKVISLELAKELQEVADEAGFELPESEYWWNWRTTGWELNDMKWEIVDEKPSVKAYDTSELVNMLTKLDIDDKIDIQDINAEYLANKLILFYEQSEKTKSKV